MFKKSIFLSLISLSRIPTRDSANVAMSKMAREDTGNEQLKTETINIQTGSGSNDKVPVWLSDFQKAMASGAPKRDNK